jgi:hypothetical protein
VKARGSTASKRASASNHSRLTGSVLANLLPEPAHIPSRVDRTYHRPASTRCRQILWEGENTYSCGPISRRKRSSDSEPRRRMGGRSTRWTLDFRNEANEFQSLVATGPPPSPVLISSESFNRADDSVLSRIIDDLGTAHIPDLCRQFATIVYERWSAGACTCSLACACGGGRERSGLERCRSGSRRTGGAGR